MTPLPAHPTIVPGPPVFLQTYGCKSLPCSKVVCPLCGKERMYPWRYLRRKLADGTFNGHCRACNNSSRSVHRTGQAERYKTDQGYIALRRREIDPGDDWLFDAMRYRASTAVLEHRFVMAKHLGRPLERWENVHHRNGKRDDNRLENLELWVEWQPPGQRVADVVSWAKEILRRYEPQLHLFK